MKNKFKNVIALLSIVVTINFAFIHVSYAALVDKSNENTNVEKFVKETNKEEYFDNNLENSSVDLNNFNESNYILENEEVADASNLNTMIGSAITIIVFNSNLWFIISIIIYIVNSIKISKLKSNMKDIVDKSIDDTMVIENKIEKLTRKRIIYILSGFILLSFSIYLDSIKYRSHSSCIK